MQSTYEDVANCQHVMENLKAELEIEGQIYDEVREYDSPPSFNMETNLSYKSRSHK